MNENETTIDADTIAEGIISYTEFLTDFKKVQEDEVIKKDADDPKSTQYTFRKFNTECYIIKKKYFDDFRRATNFDALNPILNSLNEENKNKFKEKLKEHLDEKPYQSKNANIKIYYELEEMKKVVKDFNNYSFVNKGICDAIGISEENLKDKALKVSKNKNDTCIISNNFTLTIPKKKIEEKKDNKKYKNLYYVEDLTKKIFTLLYFFDEEVIQKKMKKEIKDEYNFKEYYLINKEWLDNYKAFFSYDFFVKKLKNLLNKNNEKYNSYKKAKFYLNELIKKIGQINLYGETVIEDYIRNAKHFIPEMKRRVIQKDINVEGSYVQETPEVEEYFTPYGFYLINKDIFELLEREQFLYNIGDSIKDIVKFKVFIGNGKIIIKNKFFENDEQKINEKLYNANEYLIYVDNKSVNFKKEDDSDKDESFILYYLLNYSKEKESLFYEYLNMINKKNGFEEFTKKLNIKDINSVQDIKDKRGNVQGNFIIFRNKEEIIMNENIGSSLNPSQNDNQVNENQNQNNNQANDNHNQNNNKVNENHNQNNNQVNDINSNNNVVNNNEGSINVSNGVLNNNNYIIDNSESSLTESKTDNMDNESRINEDNNISSNSNINSDEIIIDNYKIDINEAKKKNH